MCINFNIITLWIKKYGHDTILCSTPRCFYRNVMCCKCTWMYMVIFYIATLNNSRSQWPRGLRRRSSAAHLLRLWVRIPPGVWISVVSVVCCQVEGSAMDWSFVQRSSTDCGASLCVIKKPRKRGGYRPLLDCENTTTMGCNARKTTNIK